MPQLGGGEGYETSGCLNKALIRCYLVGKIASTSHNGLRECSSNLNGQACRDLPYLKLTGRTWKWAQTQLERIVFQASIFRGENVSFREGNLYNKWPKINGFAWGDFTPIS